MLTIAHHFHVLPRYHDQFRHAWHAAHDSLAQALGLVSFELKLPRERREAFTLMLAWDSQTSFERFTRTWVGVWMLNGMGLGREAFTAPIQTDTGVEEFAYAESGHTPRVGKRAA